ncbi:hypothetical protein CTAM01_12882 [Colletotrichum tamarilloi]|uniref:Uncharacterized protein n=1 Tax=Colletotrichum tamarilloi TaxID=1209934 RepID=A0ABQ9QTK5_9PEZI|nr:uncharacterized protein CTAM01_12882 [Colletotrichum tamarilloi]KAK1484638.1 hypothetical protein CTAM01_12882 [Colletotrichum tamarilloi]
MKFQVLPLVALLAAHAYAACGPDETELFDLQVTTGTSQCSNFGCFKACTFPDGSGSCNGCTQSVSNDHIRPLGGSYCCKGPLTGQTNTCITGCPAGQTTFYHNS